MGGEGSTGSGGSKVEDEDCVSERLGVLSDLVMWGVVNVDSFELALLTDRCGHPGDIPSDPVK